MSNLLFYYFESENEKIIARAKVSGDNILPLSCYYDPADVNELVRTKLKKDIFPILNFLEKEICRVFEILMRK